jgi:dipeptidyl aminopeptidase/acylaminoacyl peptidase
MPIPRKFPTLAVLVTAFALLAAPAAADAALTFVRNPLKPAVYVANDNGTQPRKVGPGTNPHMAPDGNSVAYLREGPGHAQELAIAPVAGGPSRTLLNGFRGSNDLAFSPDSSQILAQRGPEIGKRKLVLLDLASGAQAVVASGFFNGFSFSPEGDEFVYGKAPTEKYPPRSDLYRYSIATGKTTRLTKDRASESPLWGPSGNGQAEIYFVKQLEAKKRQYGPKNEIYSISPNGGGAKRITHTRVGPLLQGLVPIAIDAEEKNLLAEFVGQDTSYAVKVNARSGAQKPVLKATENGFVGGALSTSGATVLGFTGGFIGDRKQNVATVAWSGGGPKILVRNAYEPDWSF